MPAATRVLRGEEWPVRRIFFEMLALLMLTFLAEIEARHWAVVAHHPCPDERLLAAVRAMSLFARQVAVGFADGEHRCDGDVRQTVIFDHLPHQPFTRFA